MRARGRTMRSIAEMRTLVGVLKDMIHRQVQLSPQAINQGCQQDSTGWGPPPPPTFQAGTNVAPITIPRVAICRKLRRRSRKVRFRKIRGGKRRKSPRTLRTLPCAMLI